MEINNSKSPCTNTFLNHLIINDLQNSITLISGSRFLLLKCRLNGVKEFIFSSCNTLDEVAGLGNYFTLLLVSIKNYYISRLKLSESHILFENNAGFTLLVPPSFTYLLDECKVYINTILARAFNGNIYFSAVSGIFEISTQGTNGTVSIHCKWKSILKMQETEMDNRFMEFNYKDIFKPYQDISPAFFFSKKKTTRIKDNFSTGQLDFIKLNQPNTYTDIPKGFSDCFSVLKSFGYIPQTNKYKNSKCNGRVTSGLDQSFSSGNVSYTNNISESSLMMEIFFLDPDSTFSQITRELNFFELIDHYRQNMRLKKEILSFYYDEKNRIDYSSCREDLQLIYQSDTYILITGKLKELLNIVLFLLAQSKKNESQPKEIYTYVKILKKAYNFSFNNSFDVLSRNSIVNMHKGKLHCINFFDEDFDSYEFSKTIELIKIFINLLKEEALDSRNQNLLLKSIFRSSLFFNKLMKDSAAGYLYINEIIKFRYYLGAVEGIDENNKNKLVKIFEDLLLKNLTGNKKALNKMIFPVACKAACLIVDNELKTNSTLI
jgi:hypothetical protein